MNEYSIYLIESKLGGANLYQAVLKSVYDYYPFGSLMPGRTVMDMTRIHRVWQPAYYLPTLPLNQLFSAIQHWGEASYRFSDDHSQLDLFIEDEQSGIELLLEEDIGNGHLFRDYYIGVFWIIR